MTARVGTFPVNVAQYRPRLRASLAGITGTTPSITWTGVALSQGGTLGPRYLPTSPVVITT